MKIICIGGGPGGLFFSILMKKADPSHDVTVIEQNPRGNTFGWGIVFSDGTMENLIAADETTARKTTDTLAHWDDIEVHFKGRVLRSSGHGFVGVGRHKFLEILENRAEELGVTLEFGRRVENLDAFADADLIVASDGINSRVRTLYADHFKPEIEQRFSTR